MITFGSLFAGIGGFDLAFERSGFQCVYQVEIDRECQKVLASRFPNATRHTDINAVTNLPYVDIICGGFPCQGLSLAGKRGGLSDPRSGLFYRMVEVINESKPAYVVWENVPGLLSADEGRDFARVLRALDDIGYCGAWTSLDAQWFGLAQRRQRIFGVFARNDIGVERCAEILSLRNSRRRDTPSRRETRARTAPSVDGSPYADRGANEGRLIAATINSGGFRTEPGEHLVLDIQQITSPDNRANPQEGDPCHTLHAAGNSVVAFSSKDAGQDAGQDATDDLSPTLRSMQVAIAFGWNKSESQTMRISDETTDALQSSPTSNPAIAFESRIARNGRGAPSEIVPPLKAESGQSGKGDAAPLTAGAGGVRRLTPTECLRLQGFPDDWFDGPELSDSAKYRCLGNAVPVPVVQWIGQRIMESLEPL